MNIDRAFPPGGISREDLIISFAWIFATVASLIGLFVRMTINTFKEGKNGSRRQHS